MVPAPVLPAAEPLTALTPRPVGRAVMLQRWADLTFLHWPVDPAEVARRLPPGLSVDTAEGAAWVALVPFEMQRIRVPRTPAVPWLCTFPEINVRTYVVDDEGRRAVWFDSLDVPRAAAVAVARTAFALPYRWAAAEVRVDGDRWSYRSRRRVGRSRPGTRVEVRVGERIGDDEQSTLERFLTARWGLVATRRGRVRHGPVEHPTWPLHRAELLELDDELVAAAGYHVDPGTAPLVHATPGVDVRVGWFDPRSGA